MILMLSPWHTLILLGVVGFILAVGAFIVLSVLLWLLWDVWKQIERENNGWDEARKRRRSDAARKGHETRRAKAQPAELHIPGNAGSRRIVLDQDAETERVLRQLDAQAKAREITPDDALGFVQRGDEQ